MQSHMGWRRQRNCLSHFFKFFLPLLFLIGIHIVGGFVSAFVPQYTLKLQKQQQLPPPDSAFAIFQKKKKKMLIPSQVVTSKTKTLNMATTTTQAEMTGVTGAQDQSKRSARRKRKKRHRQKRKTAAEKRQSLVTEAASETFLDENIDPVTVTTGEASAVDKKKVQFPKAGNIPDLSWRAIPLHHLRQHPRFEPLPLPVDIESLTCLEDVRNFRQDSWQWDTLHAGRCTTSQAASALGFLEPAVAQLLGIPPSWVRGGKRLTTFQRLRQSQLQSLHEMNAVLCEASSRGDDKEEAFDNISTDAALAESNKNSSIWHVEGHSNKESSPFVARYTYQTTKGEVLRRKEGARNLQSSEVPAKTARLTWGNTQEATALLTALNYFSSIEGTATLKEVGMCGAGLDFNRTNNNDNDIGSSLQIGASPDAILVHSDGRMEALEVKNHCPFYTSFKKKSSGGSKKKKGIKKGNNNKKKLFFTGDRPFENNPRVFPHYVPQLQMEMLCLSKNCQSAIMVRQTATKGAVILRMQRDDSWIEEMLYFLNQFQRQFVALDCLPPSNFFWHSDNDEERARYRKFVDSTLELSSKVEVVARIPNHDIQRAGCDDAPLFLDEFK